jgi:hypothetical protein
MATGTDLTVQYAKQYIQVTDVTGTKNLQLLCLTRSMGWMLCCFMASMCAGLLRMARMPP